MKPSLDKAIEACAYASELLKHGCIIIDTETTGLGESDKVIEVAALKSDGVAIINSLVKTTAIIGPEAFETHGIDHGLIDRFGESIDTIAGDLIRVPRLPVVMYNADFDLQMLAQTFGAEAQKFKGGVFCAMKLYADFYQEPSTKGPGYKWQSLSNAAKQQHVEPDGYHRAFNDCKTTLGVLKAMAAHYDSLRHVRDRLYSRGGVSPYLARPAVSL